MRLPVPVNMPVTIVFASFKTVGVGGDDSKKFLLALINVRGAHQFTDP